jgi:hypothetical protein
VRTIKLKYYFSLEWYVQSVKENSKQIQAMNNSPFATHDQKYAYQFASEKYGRDCRVCGEEGHWSKECPTIHCPGCTDAVKRALFEPRVHCQGCIDNQPNQLAHDCLFESVDLWSDSDSDTEEPQVYDWDPETMDGDYEQAEQAAREESQRTVLCVSYGRPCPRLVVRVV